MIDIETLGLKPGSVILSIGAVAFDAVTGELGPEFYGKLDLATSMAMGMTVDPGTIAWWMKQSDEARAAAFDYAAHPLTAVEGLTEFIGMQAPERVWAKPPSFDLVLLEALFAACHCMIPWHYRSPRDCRTLFDLANIEQPKVGTAHDALDDARSQARGVILAYSALGFTKVQEV